MRSHLWAGCSMTRIKAGAFIFGLCSTFVFGAAAWAQVNTNTPTITPTYTKTFSPTYTPTSCRYDVSANSLPANPVSAGTTAVGAAFGFFPAVGCGGGTPASFTTLSIGVTMTGNLAYSISQAQLC